MSYKQSIKDNLIDGQGRVFPLGGIVLAALFCYSATIFVTAFLFPKVFQPHPFMSLGVLLLFALLSAFYNISVYDLRFPFGVHLLVFIIIQYLGLVWRMLDTHCPLKLICDLLKTLTTNYAWLLITIALWQTAGYLCKTFYCLFKTHLHPRNQSVKNRQSLWEDSNEKDNAQHLESQWRAFRISVFTIMIVGVASFVFSYSSLHLIDRYGYFVKALLFIFIIVGFFLVMRGFFFYKSRIWEVDHITNAGNLIKIWSKYIIILTLVLAFLVLLIPVNFQPIKTGWLLSSFNYLYAPTNHNQIRFTTTGPQETKDTKGPTVPDFISTILFLFLFLFLPLLGLSLILLTVGYWLLKFGIAEIDTLKGLKGALIKFFLFWKNLWAQMMGSQRVKGEGFGSLFGFREAKKTKLKNPKKFFVWGRGPRFTIRQGFYNLIKNARAHGLNWRETYTPREMTGGIVQMVPDEETAINQVTDAYHKARYGEEEPSKNTLDTFARNLSEIYRGLKKK